MKPQAQEILDRIDEYLKFVDDKDGHSSQANEDCAGIIEDIRRQIIDLRNLASIDQVPPGAKFRGLKRIFGRFFRLISR